MSLADRVPSDRDILADLPLALGIVGLLVASFFVGSIVGAEAIATGEPVFPPTFLPGLIGQGQATDTYLQVYETTKMALWICSIGVLGAVVLSALVDR